MAARILLAALVSVALVACGQNPPEDNPDGGDIVDGGETDGGDNPDGGGDPDGGSPDPENQIVVVRLNEDGTQDSHFGESGVATLQFGEGEGSVQDSLWDVAVDGEDRVVLFGAGKAADRDDQDRYVARLLANGALDESFATGGKHTLDTNGLSDNGRRGIVQADGKILASGYVNQPTGVGTQSANSIVLLRLNEDGTPDDGFGTGGVVNVNPFSTGGTTVPWGMAEAYAVGQQMNGDYVTTGYGREAATGTVDVVSFRFSADNGDLDGTWGVGGALVYDHAADQDRGRHLVVLPDDRTVQVGSAATAPSTLDAMVLVSRADGTRDDSFDDDGVKLYDFGNADEAFFAAAVSPDGNYVAAGGYSTTANGADAALLILPVGGSGTGFSGLMPFSVDLPDRIWSVAFNHTSDKVYAVGFVGEEDDHRMVVARFNLDGGRDVGFGTNGIVTLNLSAAGTAEAARGVALQSDGKIIVAGVAEKQ